LITQLTTPAQCSQEGKLIDPFTATISASHANDPSYDYHFFTGEYIGRSGLIGNSEFHALINAPQFNTLSTHHSVPPSLPDTGGKSEKLQHTDSTQAIGITPWVYFYWVLC